MPTVEQDIADVKRVHDEWWDSNADFDIPRMRACFASGTKFLQYNLNGHTYRSVDELTQLWQLIGQNYGIPELEVIDMRIEVRGDMAWVSHEALIRRVAKPGGKLPPSALPFRAASAVCQNAAHWASGRLSATDNSATPAMSQSVRSRKPCWPWCRWSGCPSASTLTATRCGMSSDSRGQ